MCIPFISSKTRWAWCWDSRLEGLSPVGGGLGVHFLPPTRGGGGGGGGGLFHHRKFLHLFFQLQVLRF